MRWRKYVSAALALILSLGLIAAPARADLPQSGSLDNFAAVREYDGRFTDLEPWFYDNVVRLYELGLTEGSSETAFGSGDETTVAQVLVFAARISCIYHTGSAGALKAREEQAGDWFSASADYLIELGVLPADNPFAGRYDSTPAPRSFVAQVLAALLPASAYAGLNGAVVDAGWKSGRYIRDVKSDADYAEAVLTLYRAGILTGYGDDGAFLPDAAILRRELTAMLTRLVDPALRVRIEGWRTDSSAEPAVAEEPESADGPTRVPGASAAGMSMAELITGPTVFRREHALGDRAAIRGNLEYMLQRGELSLTVRIPGNLSRKDRNTLMENYQECMREHFLEQSCAIYESLNSSPDGTYTKATISFGSYITGNAMATARNQQVRDQTMDYATAVHDELWVNGSLTPEMTQRQIARVYYDWIANHCRYDNEGLRRDTAECHMALGLFRDGKAVCDGYTMAYNLLLEIEGIDCDTACTEEHIWTVATLDGTPWHIDTTWGDQEGGINYDHFCMTEWEAYHRSGL